MLTSRTALGIQTVWAQIRLLLEEQSDLGPHCLLQRHLKRTNLVALSSQRDNVILQANMRIVDEAYAVAKLGIIINSSINFILYCVGGRWFRKELVKILQIFCGCKERVPVPGYYDTYSFPDTNSTTPNMTTTMKSEPAM